MRRVMILMLFACLAGNAIAGLYKWVDETGAIHYSDKPPKDHSTQEIEQAPQPMPDEVRRANERNKKIDELLNNTDREREELQNKCDQARLVVRQMSLPGPGVVPLGKGQWLKATGDKKDSLRKHYEGFIKKNCR